MKVRFDINNDVIVEDIPDDIMAEIERRALEKGWSSEDELRDTFNRAFMNNKFLAD